VGEGVRRAVAAAQATQVNKCRFCDWVRPTHLVRNGRSRSTLSQLLAHIADQHPEYAQAAEKVGDYYLRNGATR